MPPIQDFDMTVPTSEIKGLLSFFPRGIVAFDVETTGLSPLTDKIIEIAGVKLILWVQTVLLE